MPHWNEKVINMQTQVFSERFRLGSLKDESTPKQYIIYRDALVHAAPILSSSTIFTVILLVFRKIVKDLNKELSKIFRVLLRVLLSENIVAIFGVRVVESQ